MTGGGHVISQGPCSAGGRGKSDSSCSGEGACGLPGGPLGGPAVAALLFGGGGRDGSSSSFFRGRFEFAAFAICLIITSACSSSVFASSRKLSSLQAQGWGSGGYFASESNIRGDHTTCILPGPRRRAFNHPRDEKLALLAS